MRESGTGMSSWSSLPSGTQLLSRNIEEHCGKPYSNSSVMTLYVKNSFMNV